MGGVFLYDGDCGFCTTSARWLQRHAVSTSRVEAWQYADLAALGLSREDCSEAVQWVEDGHRSVGPDALAAYLQTSSHSWQTAGRVLTAPVSKRVTWPVYQWVARHRAQMPGGARVGHKGEEKVAMKGIRRRKSGDLAACAHVLRLVSAQDQYPIYWPQSPRGWLEGDDVIDAWVMERHGEILGHVAICEVGRDASAALRWREITGHEPSELAGISRLFVRPRARGHGIGSALLDTAVEEIHARGRIPVLDVVSASQDAVKLYDDRGWRRRASYPWGHKADGLEIHYYVAPEGVAG